MKLQEYQNEFDTINGPGVIPADCNSITFLNTGAVNMQINGINIVPGAQLIIDGNAGEIDVTRYRLSFSAGAGNSCTVIRKIYK